MSKPDKKKEPAASSVVLPWTDKAVIFTLGLIHVVCPLMFFTNLTRNPYYTQIVLLNLGIVLCFLLWAVGAWWKGEVKLPRLPFEWPLAIFLLTALASTVYSWQHHPDLRSGIFYEGVRVWIFTLVNSVMALYLPVLFTRPLNDEPIKISIWSDLVLATAWGCLWLGYSSLRDPDAGAGIWDTYGAFLWALAAVYAYVRTKDGKAISFFHVIMAVSYVAAIYGVIQYAGRDLIWGSLVQPYGGRPVSSFGNPNFLSTHLMLVSPVAAAFVFKTDSNERWGYAAVSLVCVIGLLCTLTRSSYAGLFAAYLTMGALLIRRDNLRQTRNILLGAAAVILLIFLFPTTPVTGVQSPLGRFTEIYHAFKTGESYGAWYQRVLIWASAWQMATESLLLGKGWGCFELFYPFYQGAFLMTTRFGHLRTHANNAHNVLMETWSQVGLMGTAASIWFIVTILAAGWFIIRRRPDGVSRTLAVSLLAGVIGMYADNFLGNVTIFFAVPAFLFWWNTGALFAEAPNPPFIVRPLTILGRGALVALMMFCIGSGVYFVKRWKQEVYYFQGFKQAKVGMVPDSIKSLERAFSWFQGDVNSNYELGNSYGRQAKTFLDQNLKDDARRMQEKALKAYDAALAANPGYDEIYFNRGVTNIQLGNMDAALKDLRLALFINPLLKDVYGSLGNLYVTRGDLKKASELFEQGVAAFPKDKEFWSNLGYTYSQLKENEKALEAYKKSLSIDPMYQQAYHNLSVVARELNRRDPYLEIPGLLSAIQYNVGHKSYGEAQRAAERLVEILPQNADAHLSLGNVLYFNNRIDKSVEAFKKAIELNPDFATARVNLAQVYIQEKNFPGAREQLAAALKTDSSNAQAKELLAKLPSQ